MKLIQPASTDTEWWVDPLICKLYIILYNFPPVLKQYMVDSKVSYTTYFLIFLSNLNMMISLNWIKSISWKIRAVKYSKFYKNKDLVEFHVRLNMIRTLPSVLDNVRSNVAFS